MRLHTHTYTKPKEIRLEENERNKRHLQRGESGSKSHSTKYISVFFFSFQTSFGAVCADSVLAASFR